MTAGRLILMGSGETAGPMVSTHRLGLERSGADRPLILDTPYGFQENASLISQRLVRFFRSSLSVETEIVSYRSARAGAVAGEKVLAALRRGRYVFAGPGSPTYALGVWRGTPIASALRDLLNRGGTVTFASAAALTAGVQTLPVYEIYKVGRELGWLEGLDLCSHLGLVAAFIPHWNNTEGQGFDTSRCYMGRRRFELLKGMLSEQTGVIGIDEHTAAVIDFGRGRLSVGGRGTVTIDGSERRVIKSGESLGLPTVVDLLGNEPATPDHPTSEPLPDLTQALASRSPDIIAETLFRVESQVFEGSSQAHRTLRAMLLEMSELVLGGLVTPEERIGRYVELLVEARALLRAKERWSEADRIRSELLALGVKLQDTPSGTKWTLSAGKRRNHPEGIRQ